MLIKHLSEPWFTLVQTGFKTVEGRPANGSFSEVKRGSRITFFHGTQKQMVKVVEIERYNCWKDMLEHWLVHTLPSIGTVEDGIDVYKQYYPDHSGDVLAIHIKTVQSFQGVEYTTRQNGIHMIVVLFLKNLPKEIIEKRGLTRDKKGYLFVCICGEEKGKIKDIVDDVETWKEYDVDGDKYNESLTN